MHRLREAGGARLSLTATVMHFFTRSVKQPSAMLLLDYSQVIG